MFLLSCYLFSLNISDFISVWSALLSITTNSDNMYVNSTMSAMLQHHLIKAPIFKCSVMKQILKSVLISFCSCISITSFGSQLLTNWCHGKYISLLKVRQFLGSRMWWDIIENLLCPRFYFRKTGFVCFSSLICSQKDAQFLQQSSWINLFFFIVAFPIFTNMTGWGFCSGL